MSAQTPKGSARAGVAAGEDASMRGSGNEGEYYIYEIILLQRSPDFRGLPAPSKLVDVSTGVAIPPAALKAARTAVGVTQRALASSLGFTQKTVLDAENALSRPEPSTLAGMRSELERRGVRFVRLPDGGVGVLVAKRGDRPPEVEEIARERRPRGRPKLT